MPSPSVLWRPPARPNPDAPLERFRKLAETKAGKALKSEQELWKWSIDQLEDFWELMWSFASIKHSRSYTSVLQRDVPMQDVPKFFVGARLNFAENLLDGKAHEGLEDTVAIVNVREGNTSTRKITFRQLRQQVARVAAGMRRQGVKPLDRVAAITSNSIECAVVFLAAATIGAIFSSVSTDMGTKSILSRLGQIRPTLIFAENAVLYNGKINDQRAKIVEVVEDLSRTAKGQSAPSVVLIRNIAEVPMSLSTTAVWQTFDIFLEGLPDETRSSYAQFEFSHPLIIVFSSGTTGEPKCIVHGAGGVLLQQRKEQLLSLEYTPGRDTLLQYTTTGWIMWTMMMGSLAAGVRLIVYDGSPLLRTDVLPELLAQHKVTHFGTSPRYLQELQQRNYVVTEHLELPHLRVVTSTGSLLSGAIAKGFYSAWPSRVCLMSISGGTDIVSCFVFGTMRTPVYEGAISTRAFAMAVAAFDEAGKETNGEGELVCTKPFPSMPVGFWGPNSHQRYQGSYFDKFEGVWVQGDFIQIDKDTGAVTMLGRSDGVLNPSGVRFGSSDIYAVVERFQEISDSICVGQRRPQDSDERVLLFIKMKPGKRLTATLKGNLAAAIRSAYSPRHVPAAMFQVAEIPTTFTGKKVELAVKQFVSKGDAKVSTAIANPDVLRSFGRYFDFEAALKAPSEQRQSHL